MVELVRSEYKVFHRKMAANRLRNKILSIYNDAGKRIEDPSEIKLGSMKSYWSQNLLIEGRGLGFCRSFLLIKCLMSLRVV